MIAMRSLNIVLLLLCCSISYSFGSVAPIAKKGVLDLRKQSFSTEIKLDGEWNFYWNRFLKPNDFTINRGIRVNFPSKWNEIAINGKTLPAFGFATYRLTILLPKMNEPLRIGMPDVYCAYQLFINGKLVAVNGKVSTNKKDFVPYWEYKAVDILPGIDTLNVILHIANFSHKNGGISKSLVIGKKSIVALKRRQTEAIDLLLTGCLFMGGFFFLGLFLLGNRDKAILFFSMYSVVYSYRIIGTENYILHSALPDISWYITIRLEYISLFLGIGLFSLFTKSLYPKDVHDRVINVIVTICLSFAAASLCLDPIYFTNLINPFLILMVFCITYLPYVYWVAYKNNRPGAVYSLLSSFTLMPVFVISLLHYWGFIPPLQLLSFAGYVGFFFLQSLVLSNRVSYTLKKAWEEAQQGSVAKSDFLSTMSHEIRTPLNSVIGMNHLLLKNNPREDQVGHLEVMLFSANNLLAIVNDILDYSKIEAGKVSFENVEMDIGSIAGNVVKGLQELAQEKNINLRLKTDPHLQSMLKGDPTRTSQVLTNLVHNAIKFTQAGFVELSIDIKDQTENTVALKIQVQDTGIGISEEKRKVIFERFTQADSSTSRSFGGTGLGLSICKRLLELQNSSLELISEEGKGSVFYFVQTFEKSFKTIEHENISDTIKKEAERPLTGVNILLVEDNPMNVLVAKSFLNRWGATVDVASNGLEALNIVEPARHHLILIDIQMPVMDGYEATRKMRGNGVTLPIIALTANLPDEIKERVEKTGMDDILVKPFLPDELYRKVVLYLLKNKSTEEDLFNKC